MFDVAAILDPPPPLQLLTKKFFKIMEKNFSSMILCGWMFSREFSKNLWQMLLQKSQGGRV